jgi:hypothetical protein
MGASGSVDRIPDNLGIAVASVLASILTIVIAAKAFAASGGRLWVAFGAPLCAAVAVSRALRSRFASASTGNDTRHQLGEGARSIAVLSLLYSGLVLVLNGLTLAFASSGP